MIFRKFKQSNGEEVIVRLDCIQALRPFEYDDTPASECILSNGFVLTLDGTPGEITAKILEGVQAFAQHQRKDQGQIVVPQVGVKGPN